MEAKIIQAIERLSYVFRMVLWHAAKERGLTAAQVQFMLYLNSHSANRCRMGQVAMEFGLSKASVSDTMKSLERKGLVSKKVCSDDRRSSMLSLTPKGRRMARAPLSLVRRIESQVQEVPSKTKREVLVFLMDLIVSFQKAGVISVSRMCITCKNFMMNAHPASSRPHRCRLTGKAVSDSQLQIDCDHHVGADLKPAPASGIRGRL